MRKTVTTVGVISTLVLVGGIASADIPSVSGVITACVQTQNGNIAKLVDTDAGQACGATERTVTWNQRGPAGPAGPQGLQGPAGVVGREVVTKVTLVDWSELQDTVVAGKQFPPILTECPAGKSPLSGGADVTYSNVPAWEGD